MRARGWCGHREEKSDTAPCFGDKASCGERRPASLRNCLHRRTLLHEWRRRCLRRRTVQSHRRAPRRAGPGQIGWRRSGPKLFPGRKGPGYCPRAAAEARDGCLHGSRARLGGHAGALPAAATLGARRLLLHLRLPHGRNHANDDHGKQRGRSPRPHRAPPRGRRTCTRRGLLQVPCVQHARHLDRDARHLRHLRCVRPRHRPLRDPHRHDRRGRQRPAPRPPEALPPPPARGDPEMVRDP
mmetsp:Transcript_28028/g.66909  ORF Transcript_28028/g.66909 Transcript_28028/m.66909 type:complete len:241 (+) Transcript_28028:241-963(+)